MTTSRNVQHFALHLTVTIALSIISSEGAEMAWVSEDVVSKARQAIVHVDSASLGGVNGFFVSADGLVVTNAAALEGLDRVSVVTAKQETIPEVRLVALLAEYNIAVLATGRQPPVHLPIRNDVAKVKEACCVTYSDGRGAIKTADGVLLARCPVLDATETRIQEQWSLGLAPDKIGLAGAPVLTADGCVVGLCDTFVLDRGGVHARTYAMPESTLHDALAQARTSKRPLPWPKAGEIIGYLQPSSDHFFDGTTFANKGLFAEAYSKFQSALTLEPDNPQILWHLANTSLVLGKLSDGEKWLHECIRVTPQKWMPHVQLGFVTKDTGDPDAALKQFGKLVTSAPTLSKAWAGLAKTLSATDRDDEAIAASKKWTELQPDSIEAWEYHATLLAAKGDFTGASRARDKASEIESLLFKVRYTAPKRG